MQSFLLSNLGPDLLYLWQGLGRWGAIKYPRWQHLGSGVRQRNGQCLDLMVLFGIYFSHILNRKTGHKRPVSICYLPWQCRKKNIINLLRKLKGIIEQEVLECGNVPHYNSIFPTPYLGVVSREYTLHIDPEVVIGTCSIKITLAASHGKLSFQHGT